MARIISEKNGLPSSITEEIIEQGGHEGDISILQSLVLETSIVGNITILKSGTLKINGVLTGDIINHGNLILNKSALLQGNITNYGAITLYGETTGATITLKSGSHTYLAGKCRAILNAEPNAMIDASENSTLIAP